MDAPLQRHSLDEVRLENRFCAQLPGDSDRRNIPRQVWGACYSEVMPTPVADPRLRAWSEEVLALLDLDPSVAEDAAFAELMGGNRILPGMRPYAMCYGGHQFGHWAGQLGDGRAINLGERVNHEGRSWMLQLKGAGPTPYSRQADGLAVLRSSIREFLCSEAMHHLGIPTTRALSLVTTGEWVWRDMFYDGNARQEPGAVVCRVAPSFLRFGSYQLFAARGELEPLRQLLDFTLRQYYPHLGEPGPQAYADWFDEVGRSTAELMVHWMRVGFVHGVMNTDNLSIHGLTIDYGPYGWLDDFDPEWTPNTTDAEGRRYRYANQPQIAYWNLLQLAQAIQPLLPDVEPLNAALGAFPDHYRAGWQAMMAAKLGLAHFTPHLDQGLVSEHLALLQAQETDMTLWYQGLATVEAQGPAPDGAAPLPEALQQAFYRPEQHDAAFRARLNAWLGDYQARLRRDGLPIAVRQARMQRVNPRYVLRNYLAQEAIEQAEQGDFSQVHRLQELLRDPYRPQPGMERYAQRRPDWARDRAGCSMLSCSS